MARGMRTRLAVAERATSPQRTIAQPLNACMPILDIETLLKPTRELPPCGPDLSYDVLSIELALAMTGRAEQQWGSFVTPPIPPDWKKAQVLSTQLLARSKDLLFAVALTRAATRRAGLAGCAEGLELLLGLVQRYWPALHPLDDEDADVVRVLALDALVSLDGLRGDLVADRAMCAGAGPGAASASALARALSAAEQLEKACKARAPHAGLDLRPLRDELANAAGPAPAAPSGLPRWHSVATDLPGAEATLRRALAWLEEEQARPQYSSRSTPT